jgi:hypothetical protein
MVLLFRIIPIVKRGGFLPIRGYPHKNIPRTFLHGTVIIITIFFVFWLDGGDDDGFVNARFQQQ